MKTTTVAPPVPAVPPETLAVVEALRLTGRVPVMSLPVLPLSPDHVPPSKAFTVWTAGSALFDPPKKITQRIALAALIESKITAKVPLMPLPLSGAVPPVPTLPLTPPGTPGANLGAKASPLNVEPLHLTGETA